MTDESLGGGQFELEAASQEGLPCADLLGVFDGAQAHPQLLVFGYNVERVRGGGTYCLTGDWT